MLFNVFSMFYVYRGKTEKNKYPEKFFENTPNKLYMLNNSLNYKRIDIISENRASFLSGYVDTTLNTLDKPQERAHGGRKNG